jgi:hypothetical protein
MQDEERGFGRCFPRLFLALLSFCTLLFSLSASLMSLGSWPPLGALIPTPCVTAPTACMWVTAPAETNHIGLFKPGWGSLQSYTVQLVVATKAELAQGHPDMGPIGLPACHGTRSVASAVLQTLESSHWKSAEYVWYAYLGIRIDSGYRLSLGSTPCGGGNARTVTIRARTVTCLLQQLACLVQTRIFETWIGCIPGCLRFWPRGSGRGHREIEV